MHFWCILCTLNRVYKRSRVFFLIIKLCCSRIENCRRYFIEPITTDPFEPTLLGVLYFQHGCQNYSGRLYSSSKKKRAAAFRGRLARLQKPRPSKTTVLRINTVSVRNAQCVSVFRSVRNICNEFPGTHGVYRTVRGPRTSV